MMSYRALPLECECGEIPEQILEVGFTSGRHLIIHYWCYSCKRVMYTSRTIQECQDFCPSSAEIESTDAEFLLRLGILSGD